MTVSTNQNQQKLIQLRKQYPLFKIEYDGKKVLTFHTWKNSSYSCWLENCQIDRESIALLNKDHMEKTLSLDLMKLYPNLYIHVYSSRDGCGISVWVNRLLDGEPDDAEAIGNINIIDKYLHKTLHDWNLEANQAKRHGWFFCTGHQCAELESNYGYFYFAGKYCKEWGKTHPEELRRAAMETYE